MLLRPVHCGDPIAYAAEDKEIRFALAPISDEHVTQFRKATRSEHGTGVPGTFPSYFRWAEFEFIKSLGVDLRNLLHTEQEYEYRQPLAAGDRVTVRTRIDEMRERRGMRFLYLHSEIFGNDELKVVARTNFIIRASEEKAGEKGKA